MMSWIFLFFFGGIMGLAIVTTQLAHHPFQLSNKQDPRHIEKSIINTVHKFYIIFLRVYIDTIHFNKFNLKNI